MVGLGTPGVYKPSEEDLDSLTYVIFLRCKNRDESIYMTCLIFTQLEESGQRIELGILTPGVEKKVFLFNSVEGALLLELSCLRQN